MSIQEDKVTDFINDDFNPFFNKIRASAVKEQLDSLYLDIIESFQKNSCMLFNIMLWRDSSHQVAQTMRFLIELTSDFSFIIHNNENVEHLNREIQTRIKRCRIATNQNEWKTIISSSKNISLLKNSKKICTKCNGTEHRVRDVFDGKTYDFYSSYTHVNMFVIHDDLERIRHGDLDDVGAQHYQIINDYPMVLRKFMDMITNLIDAPMDSFGTGELINNYNEIFEDAKNE